MASAIVCVCLEHRDVCVLLFYAMYARFASPHNQRVTESLIERILQDHLGMFDPKDIKSKCAYSTLHQ